MSFGWTGDPLVDGSPTPPAHDGMATFHFRPGRALIVRNHEVGRGTPFGTTAYDPEAGGGTTTVEFDTRRGRVVKAWASVSGTIRNCAGGPTPWGSWLTCEEAMDQTTLPHGYIFEVPADGRSDAKPLKAMGRFTHEALAVDPRSGFVYETEDAGDSSGFYRFMPKRHDRLSRGGTLSMLRIAGFPEANLKWGQTPGVTYDVEWVRIPEPNSDVAVPGNFVWAQGRAQGAATFGRLEGAWYGNRRIYFVSTNGGGPTAAQSSGQGQIWEYNPRRETLTLLFQSPGADVLNAPDNITVSPRGGLVLCEDGGGLEFLHGLTVDGEIFKFAQNNVVLNGERNGITGNFTGSEFAGACYSPGGRWLFANVQSPGITFAITGPRRTGAL
jgi:secreted PhoX family phosphatase